MVKEVKLVKLPTGEINLVPVEKITGTAIIKPDEKTGFWIHEKTIPGGSVFDPGLSDEVIIRDPTPEDIEAILKNDGKCYVDVDWEGKLSMPSNGLGFRKVVIHLTKPVEEKVAQNT